MHPTDTARGLSPEMRAGIFHFTVFGSMGVATAYFGIWLANRGIGPEEIGIINAVPLLAIIAINTLVGRIADRANDWKQVIVVLSLVAGILPIGLFFVSGFWGILLVWTLCLVPAWTMMPVLDAATLRMAQRRGSEFSSIRVWGTVGYTVQLGSAGLIIGWLGDAAFLPLFLAWSVVRATVAIALPRFRAPPHEAVLVAAKPAATKLREVLKPWFVLPIIGLGTVYGTSGVLGSFGALLWSRQGIPETLIGPLFATAAAAEATMMFLWHRLNIKASARHLIAIAALAAAVRWAILSFSPPVWLLFISQLLHAITFAVGYFGGVYFIANWTSEDIAAEAQGFSFVTQQGMMMVAIVAFGWLFAALGASAWLIASGICIAGIGCVWLSLRLMPVASRPAVQK